MVFGLFKKKDQVCGMKQEEGKGIEKHDKWFCSNNCLGKYEQEQKRAEKKAAKSCCGP